MLPSNPVAGFAQSVNALALVCVTSLARGGRVAGGQRVI